jgi:fibronectin type 3 domain-containing protein
LRRPSFLPVAILAIFLSGIVGVVLFRVAADQKPHTVLLKWNPPTPKPGSTVVSYEVYRSEPDGSFKKLASGVIAPSYVDHDVSSGKTYDYFVRAVDAAGNRSSPSNHASATIP